MIPLFLFVARLRIQSDSTPFVASPMNAPIEVARFKKHMVWLELYGEAAKAWLCVRLTVKYELTVQNTRGGQFDDSVDVQFSWDPEAQEGTLYEVLF